MDKVTQRLSREDWILAGFRALTTGGAGALRVEAVARDLGSTKGSFYWHFADPADWRAAMLAYWENVAFRGIVAALQALPAGEPRLRALAQIAVRRGNDASHGGTAAEPALRAWAHYAPDVAEVVGRVDSGRIAFLAECFRQMRGDMQDASGPARRFYVTYLGLQVLPGTADGDEKMLLDLISSLCG